MDKKTKDQGVILMLLERFNKWRLPRALDLKKRVAKGECLDKKDHTFLKSVMADASQIRPLVARNPQHKEFYDEVVAMYKEIIEKDKENQKAAKK